MTRAEAHAEMLAALGHMIDHGKVEMGTEQSAALVRVMQWLALPDLRDEMLTELRTLGERHGYQSTADLLQRAGA